MKWTDCRGRAKPWTRSHVKVSDSINLTPFLTFNIYQHVAWVFEVLRTVFIHCISLSLF